MHVDVELELVRLRERLAAELAHARLLLGVCAPHVAVVRGVRGERAPAVLALERLLAAVLPDVRAQDGRGGERFDAERALVRPLAAVHAHVLVEAGRLREALVAHAALVRPVLLVHVQHVDAQSVALVERTIAQRAGELPIALVDASSVLEVSVPVVLVCENLAATVT